MTIKINVLNKITEQFLKIGNEVFGENVKLSYIKVSLLKFLRVRWIEGNVLI